MINKRSVTLIASVCIISCISPLSPKDSYAQTTPQPETARHMLSSVLIRWEGKPGVERYRLQLATDVAFNDVILDQAVIGRQHLVEGLATGNYYWRVAPAAKETGAFAPPNRIEVTGSKLGGVTKVVGVSDAGGWRTATGEVLRPASARLREGANVDFVAMNRQGTVYAIDGTNGVALWTARYDVSNGAADNEKTRSQEFAPVFVQRGPTVERIVIGFEAGVRALRGDSGREIWRAKLDGRPAAGTAGDLDEDGVNEVIVVTQNPNALYFLSSETGRLVRERKLDAGVFGAPVIVAVGESRGVLLVLENGLIEIRGKDGSVVKSSQLGIEATTAPLVVRSAKLSLVVIGSRDGLMALSLDDLKLMRKIVPEGGAVRGTLATADVDSDGSPEIVLLTRRGRIALVSMAGNVKWYAEGAHHAEVGVFADVNTDGILDVIVPDETAFAIGYSGRDGSLIWKVGEGGGKPHASNPSGYRRTLVVAPHVSGGIIVGGDPARTGLRAVELPDGATKAVAN